MIKASQKQITSSLKVAKFLSEKGIAFVVVPARDDDHFHKLIKEGTEVIENTEFPD